MGLGHDVRTLSCIHVGSQMDETLVLSLTIYACDIYFSCRRLHASTSFINRADQCTRREVVILDLADRTADSKSDNVSERVLSSTIE